MPWGPRPTVICFTSSCLSASITFTLSEPIPDTYTLLLSGETSIPWCPRLTGIFFTISNEVVLIITQNYILLPNGKRLMHSKVTSNNNSVIITENGIILKTNQMV